MMELVESIKEKGVLSPAIVRRREEGGYEIVSGHRRRRACQLAEIKKMPVIIKDLDDEEATILMVDANIQRENILPSERAFAYKMRMEAESRQGRRDTTTSRQVVEKLTSDKIGENDGMSGRQVNRYVRLTCLLPEILEKVDKKKLGFVPAVNISFIDTDAQKWILSVINETQKKVTLRQSDLLRKSFEEGNLTEEEVCRILLNNKDVSRNVTFTETELSEFFPKYMDSEEIKKIIKGLLENWKEEYQ